jgi:hypothetical protein
MVKAEKKKHLALVLLLVSIVVLIPNCYYFYASQIVEVKRLNYKTLNQQVYLRARTWGLAANHDEITISQYPFRPKDRSNRSGDIVLYSDEVFFKLVGGDSLLLYINASAIGKGTKAYSLIGNVKVIIYPVHGYCDTLDIKNNYARIGLERLSTFRDD